MVSLGEAFQKLLEWKQSNALLKITGTVPDMPLVTDLLVSVVSVDQDRGFVGLIREERPHDVLPLNLSDARFDLSEGQYILEARLRDGERWVFKELPPS
jgi:hypothetical protein